MIPPLTKKSMHMSENFYIRIRGEVKGPLSREQIVSLIRKKRLGKHHEVSPDAVTWSRAGDVEGLFESTVPSRDDDVAYALPASDVAEHQANESPEKPSSTATVSDNGSWYYAKGRNSLGPISSQELRTMLATRRLQGSDRVWNETMADWVPAGDLPQFMGSVRDEPERLRQLSTGRNTAARASFIEILFGLSRVDTLPEDSVQKFPNLTRYLLIAESVNRIFLVLAMLAAVGWYIFTVGVTFKTDDPSIIAVAVFLGGLSLAVSLGFAWFIFIAGMAFLEFLRIMIRIEHNTTQTSGTSG